MGSARVLGILSLLASCASPAPPDRIFVGQAGSATILAVDAESGAIEARIEVGMLPHNLVLSPDKKTLYAAVVGSQAIAEIDVAGARLRRTFLTAPVPAARPDGTVIQEHVDRGAFDHTTCYDCHRPGGAQPKYAGARPFGLLLSPDGTHLLVSHLRTSDIAVLDLATGRIERTVHLAPAGTATEAVALARLGNEISRPAEGPPCGGPLAGEIWVALRPPQPSTAPGALRRLDAATLTPLGDVPAGADPSELLAFPAERRILVSNFESDSVTEHRDGAATVHTVAPGPLGLTPLPSGGVLALDYYSNAVSVLDLGTGAARTVRLEHEGAPYANPTHAAVSSDGHSAWIVTGATSGHLLQLDLASLQVVRDVPIDGLSFGVALVPGSAR